MSILDEAMSKHINYIVLHEHRPFSFKDFLQFEVDGSFVRKDMNLYSALTELGI